MVLKYVHDNTANNISTFNFSYITILDPIILIKINKIKVASLYLVFITRNKQGYFRLCNFKIKSFNYNWLSIDIIDSRDKASLLGPG